MRYHEFLIEYDRNITKQKIGDKLLAAGKNDRKQDVDTILSTLENIDPTNNKQYMVWLANQYINRLFRLEDAGRVSNVLKQFVQVKSRLPEKDINRYTFHSLEDKMDEIFNVELQNKPQEQQTFEVPEDTEVLYNGPLGLLAIPKTYEASCELGSGTKWCTSGDSDSEPFDAYTLEGPLYIWRDKTGKKYQFHFPSMQFMDSRDRPIDHKLMTYFRTQHPVLKKLFQQKEKTLLEDPKDAAYYASAALHGRWPEAEPIIMQNPEAATFYATQVIKGRWPEAEPFIATNPYSAFLYARDVLKDRFPAAEKSIIKDVKGERQYLGTAYLYARDVIKGRWPEIEPFIASLYGYEYARDVIKGRWPEAEKYILRSPGKALSYVEAVIKGRWPEAEPVIASHPYSAFIYARDILKDRFPAAEKNILHSAYGQAYTDIMQSHALEKFQQKLNK